MHSSLVLLPAVISAAGLRASCEILARKQTLLSGKDGFGSDYTYTDCSIIGAPRDLPAGDYNIQFDAFVLRATCHGGRWLPNGHPSRSAEVGAMS